MPTPDEEESLSRGDADRAPQRARSRRAGLRRSGDRWRNGSATREPTNRPPTAATRPMRKHRSRRGRRRRLEGAAGSRSRQPDMFSPFAADDEVEPRRRSPLSTILIVALVVMVRAALFWFLAPRRHEGQARPCCGRQRARCALVTTHMDRQRLESGNELLTVTGRVINPTAKEQDVPPIQAQLKNRGRQGGLQLDDPPPARSLPAGASASFNSAEVNVPPGGDELTITLGEPTA